MFYSHWLRVKQMVYMSALLGFEMSTYLSMTLLAAHKQIKQTCCISICKQECDFHF